MQSAWAGLDASQVWDAHAHLAGTGDSGSGIVVNPQMESLLSPMLAAALLTVISDILEEAIIDMIEEAAAKTAFVVVDLEGTASMTVAYAISRADLVVIPVQGSQLDAAEAAISRIRTVCAGLTVNTSGSSSVRRLARSASYLTSISGAGPMI